MTRLVHVTTLPQTAASFLAGQLRWLTQQGFDVTVISSPGAQLQEFAEQEGIHADSVPMTREISPFRDAMAVHALTRKLRRIRPQIVHAHTPKAGLIAMLAAKQANTPVRIYHLHGLRFETSTGWRRCVLRTAERRTCRLAHRVLCVSPSLRQRAESERLGSSRNFQVLANGSINGLDVEAYRAGHDQTTSRRDVRQRFGIPEHARCIGFVGRMVRDKGVLDLFEAWRTLREKYANLHLLLVGPFETGDAVPTHIRVQIEQDPRVHLTGLDWNVRPYYAAMDVFTLPSHREGLGNVLLEAAAFELPTVTCRATGCVDAIRDGLTGQLVPVGNPAELARSLARYLDSAELRQVHGKAGREWVTQQFRPERIWQAVLAEYHDLLVQHGVATAFQEFAHASSKAVASSQGPHARVAA